MKRALALAWVMLMAAPALADEIPLTGVQFRLEDDFASIYLLGGESLPEPRVRIGRGQLRAWFSGVEHQRITTAGDGTAIRDIRVRSGAGATTLVHIRLGDARELADEDISVTPYEGGTVLRIRRAALAMLPEPAAAPAEETEEEATPAEEAAPAESGFLADDAPEALIAAPAGEGKASTGLMLSIIAGLAFILLLVRVLGRKRSITEPSDIEVVSAKRLGPKHQLVVVRALGEEHLLSVSGGQTQLITSTQRPDNTAAFKALVDAQLPVEEPRDHQGLGLTQTPAAPKAPSLNPAPAASSEERFGARLLELATGRKDRASVGNAKTLAASKSPVSGLLDLRRRIG